MTAPPHRPRRPRAALVGLTGAIAAGKSAALAMLGKLGAATLSTDEVVHDLLVRPGVRERLVERWGPAVARGAEVDRGAVGTIVFASPDELEWLESLLHPLVGERVAEWAADLPDSVEVAVVEVPLLFESEMEAMFDATLVVTAPDEVRAERAAARGAAGLDGRAGRQLSQEEKAARATHVVVNDGELDHLEERLRALWPELAAAGGER